MVCNRLETSLKTIVMRCNIHVLFSIKFVCLFVVCALKVNRGDEGSILFLIYELLMFITERGTSFLIAEVFLIWL